MRQSKLVGLELVILLVLVIVAVAYSRRESALRILTLRSAEPTTVNGDSLAPDFAKGIWINSDPLTLKDLRGRVVVVDFWTFACYNCRNTLPYVKAWDARYRDKGLTIVGVHSPELSQEKEIENVRREVASLGIHYPVVTDNNFETWRAYNVEAWPTIFVLDKQGHLRWTHVGEGAYEETEKIIQRLLTEERGTAGAKISADRHASPARDRN